MCALCGRARDEDRARERSHDPPKSRRRRGKFRSTFSPRSSSVHIYWDNFPFEEANMLPSSMSSPGIGYLMPTALLRSVQPRRTFALATPPIAASSDCLPSHVAVAATAPSSAAAAAALCKRRQWQCKAMGVGLAGSKTNK